MSKGEDITPLPATTNVPLSETPSNEKNLRIQYDEAAPETSGTQRRWWHPLKEPGSAIQIVIAAIIAIAIGMAVNATVDTVPPAALAILGIPGRLWLRALTAVGESWSFRADLSATPHHHGYDSRNATTERDDSGRKSIGQMDYRLLFHDDCNRHQSFFIDDCSSLATIDDRGRFGFFGRYRWERRFYC